MPTSSESSIINLNLLNRTKFKTSILFRINISIIRVIPKTTIFFNMLIQDIKTAVYQILSINSKGNHPTTQNWTVTKFKTCNFEIMIKNLPKLNRQARSVPPYSNKSTYSGLKNLNSLKKLTGSTPLCKK